MDTRGWQCCERVLVTAVCGAHLRVNAYVCYRAPCALWVSVYFTFATLSAEALSTPTHLWFAYVFAAVSFRLFGGRFLDRGLGPKQWVTFSILIFGIAHGTLAFAQYNQHSFWVWISAGCAGLGHGMGFPLCTSLVISYTPSESRGSAVSIFTGLWDLMGVIGLPLMGWIADEWGLMWMLSGTSLGSLIILGGWWRLRRYL